MFYSIITLRSPPGTRPRATTKNTSVIPRLDSQHFAWTETISLSVAGTLSLVVVSAVRVWRVMVGIICAIAIICTVAIICFVVIICVVAIIRLVTLVRRPRASVGDDPDDRVGVHFVCAALRSAPSTLAQPTARPGTPLQSGSAGYAPRRGGCAESARSERRRAHGPCRRPTALRVCARLIGATGAPWERPRAQARKHIHPTRATQRGRRARRRTRGR